MAAWRSIVRSRDCARERYYLGKVVPFGELQLHLAAAEKGIRS
jgi:hypothetical protein